ncbi:MAG: right-handed parallel beta-helix repeat-containing protein [Clostridia bacterium]|nr:right-handed parallel beta-helix repeat-containing protein [Clostridia bacterium]
MKSFNSRLQNDLFPKKPAAFDRMVRQKLDEVSSQPEESQAATVRFSAAEGKRQPVKTRSKLFVRIGSVAVAAILAVSTLAVGAIAVLAGKEKSTPAVPVAETPTAGNTVPAATVDEFLAAIASDTTVVLTGDVYNLSAASDYGVGGGNHYTWREVEDGYELVLRNLEHFRIVGSENAVIETDPRHAAVLEAEHCLGLSLSDLTVGHTKRPEKCSGEVICLTECTDTRIERCALYGCGSWGITAWYGENLTVTGSEIYECSSGALHIWECAGVSVAESVIRNCGGGGTLADLIYIQDSNVSIRNCDIYENTTEGSLIYVGDAETEICRISLVGVDAHDNRLTHRSKYVLDFTNPDPDESDRMTVHGCSFRNNGDNRILPGSSRVFDLDGNELGEAELQAMTLQRDAS